MNDTATTARVPSPTTAMANEAPDNIPAVHQSVQQLTDDSDDAPPQTPRQAVSEIKEELTGFGGLTGAIAAVMAEIEAVEKGGKNKFHDYKYARMQDILTVLTPLMGKHGLVIFQTEYSRMMFDNNNVLAVQYQFTVAHKSGEVWPQRPLQTGVSKCRNTKDGFDDKAWNKAHTAARKYFLLALFQIPTEDEDADTGPQKSATSAPVPGPTGYTPPHRIEPVRGETSDTWATKYESHIKHAKTAAELVKWDEENDGLLSTLNEKAPERYSKVMAYVATLQATLASAFVRAVERTTAEKIPNVVRPEGCPDPNHFPDDFLAWADKRMAAISDPEALEVVFQNEIDPASDGLMKPDYDALQAALAVHQKRLGSD